MNRSFQKVAATCLGMAIAFPLFMGLGMSMKNNLSDPGLVVVALVVLAVAFFAGK